MAEDGSSGGRPLTVRTLSKLIDRIQLAWHLFRDDRVSPAVKAIPLMGLLYLIWPLDLLPDLFPALGQLDDIAVLLLALNWFIRACPSDVVEDIRSGTKTISARYTVIDDSERPKS
ncbi:MAG: YkvA family protein [Anaerolineae bacterium]